MAVSATFRIDAELSAGVWTSLGTNVLAGVHARRGMPGGGPLDRIATLGTLDFALRNHAGNTGGIEGWFSPNHASVRTGWTYGIGIRLVSTYSAVDRTLWRGKLRVIDPIAGTKRRRAVRCQAHDSMADFAENGMREVTSQVDQTENALIAAVIAAMPSTARPPATTYDASLDTYPYAFDNATSETSALSLLADVVHSAGAYAYPLADGTFHVENRQARTTGTSTFTFTNATLTDVTVPSNLEGVFNRVRVTIHPRRIDAAATTVLFAVDHIIQLAPAESKTLWGDYVDPTDPTKKIGGTAQVTPVANTDYGVRPNSDGSGSDISADVTVTATAFGASVKFVLTNNGSVTAYFVNASGVAFLQIRGKGIYDEAPVTVESYTAKDYGDRLLEVDLRYQDDDAVAQSRADFWNAQYNAVQNDVLALSLPPQQSDALMLQALTGEIGDIVTLSETMTGISAVEGVIQGIEYELGHRNQLFVRYILAPRGPSVAFLLDDAVYGVFDDANARLGYL